MKLYLDYAATSSPSKECVADFNEYVGKYANPSSHYCSDGFRAYTLLEESRKRIAEYINAEPEEIYFTSGSTESINWAIRGYLEAHGTSCNNLMCTPVEHPAMYNCMMFARHFYGKFFDFIPIDNMGSVDLKKFSNLLRDSYIYKPLVGVIMVNNEVGTINDIKSISDIVHSQANGTLLLDATQAICHVPIDVKKMDIDMMVMSGHKIGAFSGSGFLYIRKGIEVNNLMYGGHQERGKRPGTENFLYDVCLGNQIERLSKNEEQRWNNERVAVTRLEKIIASIANKDKIRTHINGANIGDKRSPNNLNITIKGLDNQKLITYFDEYGITVSAGSACSSGENKPSRVLRALNIPDDEIRNTIRLSVNGGLTDEQLKYFQLVFSSAFKFLIGEE